MPEPSDSCVRPTTMMRAAMLAVLLILAGCGSAESGGSAAKSKPSPSSTVVACMAGRERLLTKADLDGDGSKELVRLQKGSRSDASCPPALVAEPAGKPSDAQMAELSPDEPPVSSAFAVALPGQKSQLVVTRADHPRGGYQLRVYAAMDHALVEQKADDQPLLPFVATDVQEYPWSIDCSADGLVFTEALAHEPPGVAAAWDIKQTTYTLDGATLTAGPTKEIADNVLPQELTQKYPELVKHSAFESCRA